MKPFHIRVTLKKGSGVNSKKVGIKAGIQGI
jgi:hypothetical protein